MPLDKSLLSSLAHLGVRKTTSFQTFDFSTLYTSVPDDLFNFPINNIISNALRQKPTIINGSLGSQQKNFNSNTRFFYLVHLNLR